MMRRDVRTVEKELPRELQHSPPRQVQLTRGGVAAMLAAVGLLASAITAAALLYRQASRNDDLLRALAEESAAARGAVVDLHRTRGKSPQVHAEYIFSVDGREYRGRARLQRADRGRYTIGSLARVTYLRSNPARNWLEGYGPRAGELWIAFVVPLLLTLPALLVWRSIRSQSWLLSEGRATLARVTKVDRIRREDSKGWRVHYEWALLSGAIRTGSFSVSRKPPEPGALVPVLYDRDNPKRHAKYPLTLTRIGHL